MVEIPVHVAFAKLFCIKPMHGTVKKKQTKFSRLYRIFGKTDFSLFLVLFCFSQMSVGYVA